MIQTATPAVADAHGAIRPLESIQASLGTPGEQFASAIAGARSSDDLTLPIAAHLPAAFPLFASRPRYPVRHLMKTVTVAPDRPATFVYEPPRHATPGGPGANFAASGSTYETTPEASFAPRLAEATFTDLQVSLPMPERLLEHPELLVSFVDMRVLVRMSVVENESLLQGSADRAIRGLLNLDGIRRRRTSSALQRAVIESAAAVEETGGSCDGIVAHPIDYWQLVHCGALQRLQLAGVTVSRTRMIPAGSLLLGDFRAATTLLLTNDSELGLRCGAGPEGGDEIHGRTRVGLAVHLPQHLMLLDVEGRHG